MTLCINLQCLRPNNSENILFCQACGSELLLEGRYRVTRQLGAGGFAKTFKVNYNNTLKVYQLANILHEVHQQNFFRMGSLLKNFLS